MKETLLIRLATTAGSEVEYAVVSETGSLLTQAQRTDDLNVLAGQAAGRQVILAVPGTDVSLFRVAVPTDNRQRMRRAVPYALEEQLADDVEDLHFAVGTRAEDGQVGVAVVACEHMAQWLAWCETAGIEPVAWYAETQLLPRRGETWTLLREPDTDFILLRHPDGEGYAIEADTWSYIASRLQAPARIQVLGVGNREVTPLDPVPGLELEDGPWANSVLEHLARGLRQADLINLRQGDYSRQQHYGRLLKPWRVAAVLLVAALLLGFAYRGVQLWQLQAREAALNAQIEQLYRDTFPQARRVVNARHQMEQQLLAMRRAQGQSEADFLALLVHSGNVFSAAGDIELTGVSFRDGRLDVELTAKDLQTLDRLKQQLAQSGRLKVEIQSATAGGNQRVEGRLRIEGTRT